MDNRAAVSRELPLRLASWTRELIAHTAGNTREAAADDKLMTVESHNQRGTVVRALLAAARCRSQSPSWFFRLPARVLELICQYLPLTERIVLSHVSHDIRDRLLSLPRVWSTIDTRSLWRCYINADMLQALAARSADRRLLLDLTLYDKNILPSLRTVTLHLHRIRSLSLSVNAEQEVADASTSDPTSWNATLDALLAPAPHLERLSLRFRNRIIWIHDEPFYAFPHAFPPLSTTLLAGHAPLLRTLELFGVRLPKFSCSAFSRLRYFKFSWIGCLDVDEVAHAVALMPQLNTLALEAIRMSAAMRGTTSNGGYHMSSSLRNLLLRMCTVDPEILGRFIDFQHLQCLDLVDSVETAELIMAAYPALSIKRLVMAFMRDAFIVEDDSGHLLTTIQSYPRDFTAFEPCLTVTWLAVHELHWPGNGVLPALPALPAVQTLRIRLATCYESLKAANAVSILAHNEPGSAWQLAALRELCITAPMASPACISKDCTCLASRSVALADVVRFVRLGMQFDAPRLDKVRLAGLRIIDTDFCAAWEEMSSWAEVVELVEEPEFIPHMNLEYPTDYDIETVFQDREM